MRPSFQTRFLLSAGVAFDLKEGLPHSTHNRKKWRPHGRAIGGLLNVPSLTAQLNACFTAEIAAR